MIMKKKLSVILLFLLQTLMPVCSNASSYQRSRIFWDMSSRRTVFGSGGYARIIQLHDGRLLATCESGGIVIAFSDDNGNTWGSPVRIVNNVNRVPNCVPDLIQLSDGTIIVAYNPRPSAPYTTGRKFGIRCKRSVDNGATWSDEIFVNDARHTFEDGCWEPSMLELPSGELQLYFADEGPYTSSNEQQISLCRSFDGGKTWSAAQKVSFRAGYRDGMPSPVLLSDHSSIVIAIEDNGWPGIGDFFPTTVRCPLADNWSGGFFVDSNSAMRQKAHNVSAAKGGAPYIRVLPWGETVLSWQSYYNNGDKLNMLTAVGDENATDFKALTHPFVIGSDQQALWNSLAVIDTGVVVAVSGIGGKVEMIKGYPMRQFEATKATPAVDGKVSADDVYVRPSANQVTMGFRNNLPTAADFAYDAENLYFVATVDDDTRSADGTSGDGVRLSLDVRDTPTSSVSGETVRLFMGRDGSSTAWLGTGGTWKAVTYDGIVVKKSDNGVRYTVETAIPWAMLGLESAPMGRHMSVNIEVQNKRPSGIVTERINDTRPSAPTTWMGFWLREAGGSTGVGHVTAAHRLDVRAAEGRVMVSSDKDMRHVELYSMTGVRLSTHSLASTHADICLGGMCGVFLLKATFADNTMATGKFVAK